MSDNVMHAVIKPASICIGGQCQAAPDVWSFFLEMEDNHTQGAGCGPGISEPA